MYSFIFTLIILIILFVRKRKNSDFSFGRLLFSGIIIWSVSFFFFFLSEIACSTVYSNFFGISYDAVVVSHETDDQAIRALVEFRDNENKSHILPLNYSSSNPIAFGTAIKVSYEEGDATAKNLSFWKDKMLTVIISVFFVSFSFIIIGIVLHALGRDISLMWRILVNFVLYILLPAAMLGFIVVLSWIIWEYLEGEREDMPIWVLGICSLFITILIPSLMGYIKMLLAKK